MIDWDVAWTGNLHRILRAFDRTRADLLTLEDRVRRLETILRNHCIGAEDEWLREG